MEQGSEGPPRGPTRQNRGRPKWDKKNKQPSQQSDSTAQPQNNPGQQPAGRGRRKNNSQSSKTASESSLSSFADSSVSSSSGMLNPDAGVFFPAGFSAPGNHPDSTAARVGGALPQENSQRQQGKGNSRGKNRSGRGGARAAAAGQPGSQNQASAPSQAAPPRKAALDQSESLDALSGASGVSRQKFRQAAQAEAAQYRNKTKKKANISDFGASTSIYDNVEAPVSSLDPEAPDAPNLLAPEDFFDPTADIVDDKHVIHDHVKHTKSRRGGGAGERIRISTEGQTELAAKLISDLLRSRYECAVCYSSIKRHVAVWSCGKCYSIFHIYCVKKWSQSSTSTSSLDGTLQWSCPKCRASQVGRPESLCFCGKTRDPVFDPYLIPHSCGEPCTKSRGNSVAAVVTDAGVVDPCPHPCGLLCHPGPCPPCSAMGATKHCFCGRTDYQNRCGVPDPGRSCGEMCLRKLSCGRHMCTLTCHPGQCGKCEQKVSQKCYCGQKEDLRPCGVDEVLDTTVYGSADPRYFSCQQLCNRPLSCGNHKCTQVCHVGPCKPCPRDPQYLRTCPCGSTPLRVIRKSCLDEIPVCDKVCNRLLQCGKHHCTQPCHTGPCETCTAVVTVPCRCGSTSQQMPCLEVYPDKYDQRVSELRCDRLCDEMKECGKHRCALRCCPAKRQKSDPDGLHICRITCNKKLSCGSHQCKQLCHRGKCHRCLEARFDDIVCPCGRTIQEAPIVCGTPPLVCPFDCVRPRPCGHPNTRHACHSRGDCPACTTLVNKPCLGGHTTVKNVPCFKQDVSCGKVCGKAMRCGLHTCGRICHAGPCELSEDPADASCGHKCEKSLATCEHTCQSKCHPSEPCPDVPCKLKSRIYCPCGRLSAEVPCTGGQQRFLSCDEKCEVEKRNRRLAEAFGILGTGKEAPKYSDVLLQMAKSLPHFIVKLEKQMDDFLKSDSPKIQLPMMDRVQRQCVHELSKYYNLDTESFDVPRIDSNMKIVELEKRRDSASPSIPLSAVAGITDHTGAVIIPSAAPTQVTTTTSILHFYDLTVNVLTSHLVSFLNPFSGEYTLQWIDESNCLAVFKEPSKMLKALHQLRGGVFKIKPYSEQSAAASASSQLPPPRPTTGGWASLSTSSGSRIRAPPKLAPQPNPFEQDNNRFALLDAASSGARAWSAVNDTSSPEATTDSTDASTPLRPPENVPDDWAALADEPGPPESMGFASPDS